MNLDEIRQQIFDSITQAFLIVGQIAPNIFLKFANGEEQAILFTTMNETLEKVKAEISTRGSAVIFFLTMPVIIDGVERVLIAESRITGEVFTHVFDINGRILSLNKELTEEQTKKMNKDDGMDFPLSNFFGMN